MELSKSIGTNRKREEKIPMKRICTLLAVLLVFCGILTAFAEDSLTTFHCAEQSFRVRIPSSLHAGWDEGNGLQISVETPGYIPYILVYRRDANLKDPVNYLNNVFREYMENKYGNDMIGTSPCKTYEIGGKTLYGAQYFYSVQNTRLCLFRLVEVRDDGDVEYTAKYVDGKEEATLAVLETVAASYTPDSSVTGEKASLQEIHCDQQAFSVRIPGNLSAEWSEGSGLQISVETPGYVPYVLVFRREKNLSDPKNYLNNVFREYMENQYGDNMIGTNPCRSYEIGGKKLLGAQYRYTVSGTRLCLFRLVESREDGDVEYTAKFVDGDDAAVLAALDAAVRSYTPDSVESVAEGLREVRCSEEQYTTRIPAEATSSYEDETFYIWLGTYDYVPNIYMVRRTADRKLKNPENYIRNVYPNYMKETFGDQLVATTSHEYLDIGGKQLPGTSYIYKSSGNASINMIHLVEVREDGDVEYVARFLNSDRETTLAALDAAVRYYQPDAAPASTARQSAPKATAAPAARQSAPKATAAPTAAPLLSGTANYGDGRFSMILPQGWQIMTQSDYMTFCFKSWDPRNPNRTIFFFMKLEPFLKSRAAKAAYQKVASSGASLYQIYADAPVMESCTLQALLDAMPQAYTFCEKYMDQGLTISPSVLPQIANAKIVSKTRSTLPAPATCKENVIARIAFEDYLGQACEGLVTAQPIDSMRYDFMGTDGWPYSVYLFMGVTAPKGELSELAPTLMGCLGSFAFEPGYVRKAVNISNEETRALLAQGETMQAAHDAMVAAWSQLFR